MPRSSSGMATVSKTVPLGIAGSNPALGVIFRIKNLLYTFLKDFRSISRPHSF